MEELLSNIDKIHTTTLGVERIKRNLELENIDVVDYCINLIKISNKILRQGKNWYIYFEDMIITVNAYSYTIITAHKNK